MRKNINAVVINTHFDERYKISILSSGLARKFLKLFFSDILDFIKFGNIVKRIQISPKIYEKMSISQDELQKIAEKLSKIPGDNSKLLGNITDILSYMDLLQEVNTDNVIPTVSVVEGHAFLRPDNKNNPTQTTAKDLLACTKQKVVADQIVLPNIMK